jgi:hypothetical protein
MNKVMNPTNQPTSLPAKKWGKELTVEHMSKTTSPITDELSMRALGSGMPKRKKVKVIPKTKEEEELNTKKYVDAA